MKATNKHNKKPAKVACESFAPRFVRSLNAIAESAGFKTRVTVERLYENSKYAEIVSTWNGPTSAWLSLTFLPATLRARAHADGCVTQVQWPTPWPDWKHLIMSGYLRALPTGIEVRLSGWDVPIKVEQSGDVEIVHYDDWLMYHGPRESLIAQKICTGKQFPANCDNQRSRADWGGPARMFSTQRHPDGLFTHQTEREGVAAARYAAYLAWMAADMRGNSGDFLPKRHTISPAAVRAARTDISFQRFIARSTGAK